MEKERRKKSKKKKEKKARYLRGRRATMILREQIDRDIYSLYAKLYLVYVQKEKEKKTQKKRKVRKKNAGERKGHVHYLLKQEFFTKGPDFIHKCF